MAIRLHPKLNYISEAPSLENHNIQSFLSHYTTTGILYCMMYTTVMHWLPDMTIDGRGRKALRNNNNSFHDSQFHASVLLLIMWLFTQVIKIFSSCKKEPEMIPEACQTLQSHYLAKFLCCDVISLALRHVCTYPEVTQKSLAYLCLYQLQYTCKCMYIPY